MPANDSPGEPVKGASRYSPEAYQFVMEALSCTVKQIGERRHLTGRELLNGIREFALDSWGLMARPVLNSWGVNSTDDFGDIVFSLIDAGLLAKTDQDKKEDFKQVYGFVEAFDKSYSPQLDKKGRIRRKMPRTRTDDEINWILPFQDTGFN